MAPGGPDPTAPASLVGRAAVYRYLRQGIRFFSSKGAVPEQYEMAGSLFPSQKGWYRETRPFAPLPGVKGLLVSLP